MDDDAPIIKKWRGDQMMGQLLANEIAITAILRALATQPDLAQVVAQNMLGMGKGIAPDYPEAFERIEAYASALGVAPSKKTN